MVGLEAEAAGAGLAVIVAAHDEAERIGMTLSALRRTFPGAALWVADDASSDGTGDAALAAGAQVVSRGRPHGKGANVAAAALAAGARVVSRGRPHGKGANVTAAAEAMLSREPDPSLVLLCDGDLGDSAALLGRLVDAVRAGECDLPVAAFARR